MSSFPPLAATGIGSVPFTDVREAVDLVLETLPEMPFWPQLVRLGYREEMVPQAARGLPALSVDAEARAVHLDPEAVRDEALAQFYEAIFGNQLDAFALQRDEARGFFALVEEVSSRGLQCQALKGQLAGPVTCAGIVKDQEGKPILYDRELTQAACQGLAWKAAWQARKFGDMGKEAVIFFDEPYLTGFGSAYMPLSRDEVAEILGDTLKATRQLAPAALGVHCCGNTDWSLLLEAPLDILSFDSYGYFDSLLLYAEALRQFYSRGGWLAWGLVPTGDDFKEVNSEGLWQRFQEQVNRLAAIGMGVKEILSRAILTPACGMGFMSPEAARGVLATLAQLSLRAQDWLAAI